MTIAPPLMPQARATLHEWVADREPAQALRGGLGLPALLRPRERADEDLWGAVGLLHDMDFEQHPNLELSAGRSTPSSASPICVSRMGRTVCRAILSHADYSGVEPESAAGEDDLRRRRIERFRHRRGAGAAGQERSTTSRLNSVRKKMKDKAFAAPGEPAWRWRRPSSKGWQWLWRKD